MSWTYEICSGKLYEDSGAIIAIGYSGGDKGLRPDAVNNPEMVSIPCVGPIPPGRYTLSLIVDGSGNAIDHEGKKAPVVRLIPDPGNQMHGRDGLLIHGDNPKLDRSASEGCVILSKDIRVQIWTSGDRVLDVVAKLPEDYF